MNEVGENFQAINDARAGAAEEVRSIGGVNPASLHGGQILNLAKASQDRRFFCATLQVEAAAGEDENFRSELQNRFPFDSN